MRNVTITLDEDVARWASVQAAAEETSVSKLVGELLRRQMLEQRGYQAAMAQFLARKPTRLERRGGHSSREELHDRAGLR
jgi:hypothetical protein